MMKCPRCNFEQPIDTFCANCGVNMQTYKRKLAGPRPLYIIGVIAAVALAGFVIFKITMSAQSLDKSVASSGKAFDDFSKELDSTTTPAAPITPSATVTPQGAVAPPPPSLSAGKSLGLKAFSPAAATAPLAAESAGTTAATPTPSPVAADRITNQLTMVFALAQRETMDKISLPLGRVGSNIISKTKYESAMRDAGFQNLSSETHTLVPSQGVLFSQGTQEPRSKEMIGFNIEVTLAKLADSSADYKLMIKRSLPDVGPQGEMRISSQDFSETVSLTAGNVYGISGMLPRKAISEPEGLLYQTNILRAMLEPAFQNAEEEFIIFIIP